MKINEAKHSRRACRRTRAKGARGARWGWGEKKHEQRASSRRSNYTVLTRRCCLKQEQEINKTKKIEARKDCEDSTQASRSRTLPLLPCDQNRATSSGRVAANTGVEVMDHGHDVTVHYPGLANAALTSLFLASGSCDV